jgi:hypothetical protein
LKLKNKGLIPKAQAEEILTDISTLGYWFIINKSNKSI